MIFAIRVSISITIVVALLMRLRLFEPPLTMGSALRHLEGFSDVTELGDSGSFQIIT